MGMVKDHRFWVGVLAAYVVLAFAPQLLINVRGVGAKASVGRG